MGETRIKFTNADIFDISLSGIVTANIGEYIIIPITHHICKYIGTGITIRSSSNFSTKVCGKIINITNVITPIIVNNVQEFTLVKVLEVQLSDDSLKNINYNEDIAIKAGKLLNLNLQFE